MFCLLLLRIQELETFLNSEIVQWALSIVKIEKDIETAIDECSILVGLASHLTNRFDDLSNFNDELIDKFAIRFINSISWLQSIKRFVEDELNEFMIGPYPDLHCLSTQYPDDSSLRVYSECLHISLYCIKTLNLNPNPDCLFVIRSEKTDEIFQFLNEQHFSKYRELLCEKQRLQNDRFKWLSSVQELESELDQKQTRICECEQIIEKLEAELDKTEKKLDFAENETDKLQRFTDELDALAEKALKVDQLEQKISRLNELVRENDRLKKENERLAKDKMSEDQQIVCLKARVRDLLTRIRLNASTEAECLLLRKKVQNLENVCEEKSRSLAMLNKHICNVERLQTKCNGVSSSVSPLYVTLDEELSNLSIIEKKSGEWDCNTNSHISSKQAAIMYDGRVNKKKQVKWELLGCV